MPGTRQYEVAVDLRCDFEHLGLLVSQCSDRDLRDRPGRDRDEAVAKYAAAMADWAKTEVRAGRIDHLFDGTRRAAVPGSELDVAESACQRAGLRDGDQLLTFET